MTDLLAAAEAPAGGSPIGQVLIATVAASIALAVLVAVGLRRRAGKSFALLDSVEAFAARTTGLPGWAALPVGLCAGSLICAVFGLYWDVSLHMDNGRDEGPLANPSHFFILGGLLGIFAAGWLASVLPEGEPGPASVRIAENWHAPVGGLVMMACASFAAIGFPLDDVWHRLFGQDVTLWGPTHMMMLTGAAFTLIGIMILMAEGKAAATGAPARSPWASQRVRWVLASGGVLIGLSIYQGEFDFGAPQFRLLHQPALIALAAGCALVLARMLGGRGAALGAAAFFIAVRALLTLIVTGAFGETVAHFPLYIVEALIVEAVALVAIARPLRFALLSGALIGTVGVVAEYGWTQLWMPIAWPDHVLLDAIVVGLPMAIGGALVGAFIAQSLLFRRVPGLPAIGGVVAIVIVFAALNPTSQPAASARVTLTDVTSSPRTVDATIRVDPATIAAEPDWLRTISWQGGTRLETHELERVSPGVYRTTEPIPVDGTWKSAIRLAAGDVMMSVPVFLPEDPGIPVAETPAPVQFERAFVSDHEILQRERKDDASGALWNIANLLVIGFILVLVGLLGWALRRVARTGGGAPEVQPPIPARPRVTA